MESAMTSENENLSRGERLQIMLSPEELAAVDDFRFKQRMPSRAAAVRELFRVGLNSAGLLAAEQGRKSSDFGVLEANGKGGKGGKSAKR
jgi:hypothetical protein